MSVDELFDDQGYDSEGYDVRGPAGAAFDQRDVMHIALREGVNELDVSDTLNILLEEINKPPYIGPILDRHIFYTKEK